MIQNAIFYSLDANEARNPEYFPSNREFPPSAAPRGRSAERPSLDPRPLDSRWQKGGQPSYPRPMPGAPAGAGCSENS
jgi:hypothetical protein